MRIAYISNSIIPSRTANSIHVLKMCQAFSDNGHEVVLFAPSSKNLYEKNIDDIYEFYGVKKNFKIQKFWKPNIKFGIFFYLLGIYIYLLFSKKFNLIYGRFLYGCYIGTLLNNKIIYETHIPNFKKKNYELFIFKKLIKNKNLIKIVVISKVLKNMFVEHGYLKEEKIYVAHDGADVVKNFNNKANLEGKKNNLKIGYVGHLYKGKGMEVINFLSNKLDNDSEIHVIGGLEKDVNHWKSKISNKKVFFYGFVPHNKISSYINSLDICLLPNQKIVHSHGSDLLKNNINISNFSSPLKLFDYMSHRKAIIASDLPAIREVLNSKNSILIKPDDLNGWLNTIRELKDFKKRKKIADIAFNDFDEYSWVTRVKKILKQVN